jgi:protein-tyrosine phosphatase
VLSIGRFATAERTADLRSAGVIHILNVSEAPRAVRASTDGFRAVEWIPLEDRLPIAPPALVQLLDTLHDMAIDPDSHVYVHCIAGPVRSPTALWLYLIACGVPPDDARAWIEERSPEATPGSTRKVEERQIRCAFQHGLARFRPHPRVEVLEPFS